MGKLDGIAADLLAAKEIVVKVKADVTSLHAKIDALGEAPTQEEIDAVKAESADLVSSLQGVDDQTPEEATEPPVEEPPVEGTPTEETPAPEEGTEDTSGL